MLLTYNGQVSSQGTRGHVAALREFSGGGARDGEMAVPSTPTRPQGCWGVSVVKIIVSTTSFTSISVFFRAVYVFLSPQTQENCSLITLLPFPSSSSRSSFFRDLVSFTLFQHEYIFFPLLISVISLHGNRYAVFNNFTLSLIPSWNSCFMFRDV